MSGRVELDWLVPAVVWNKFAEQTLEEYDGIEYYVARNAELAIEESIGWDHGEAAEDLADRLSRAAGRRPCDGSKNKIAAKALNGAETVRVRVKVHPDLKEAYASYMRKHSEHRVGIAFAYTLLEWLDGRRVERIARKLERVVDDAEGLLAEASDSPDSLSTVEKRTIAIAKRIDETNPAAALRSDIHDAIGAVTGSDSEYMRERYTERVIDRLRYEPHPNNSELFVPGEAAKERRREAAEREAEAAWQAIDDATVATDGGVDVS